VQLGNQENDNGFLELLPYILLVDGDSVSEDIGDIVAIPPRGFLRQFWKTALRIHFKYYFLRGF
jgi:hypothetical protein